MLQQIIKDMYIDPEILAELSDEQREILFCKMREEQVRQWKINEAEYEKKMRKAKKKKKKDGKSINWLLGADSKEWVWVMGDHVSDFKIEDILEKERLERANQIAQEEAEAASLREEEELRRREEEERILREEQERLAKEQKEIERKAKEEEERIRQVEAAEREMKEQLAREQAVEEERLKAIEEAAKKLQEETKAKCQKAAAEERERLAREEEARWKEEKRIKLEKEKKRQEVLVRQKAEQEARRVSMEAAKRKKEQLEREKQEKDRQARELAEKARKVRLQAEKEKKAHEEREKQSKRELKHRVEELYVGLKKTDEDKMKMEETDRAKIENIWNVQLRRSKLADTERTQRARWAREEIRQSRLSGNFENLTLDEIYKQGLVPEEKPILRPASGMPRPSQPVGRADVVSWYKEHQHRKQAGMSVDINGSRPAKWFHGVISRQKANEILEDKKPGSFLVRVSEKVWGYVLSYRCHDKVKHFLIDASGETYQFFGADPSKQHSVHNRLGDLITYHKVIPISQHGKEILRESCGQEGLVPDYTDLFVGPVKDESTSL